MYAMLAVLGLTVGAAAHDIRSRTVPDTYPIAIAAIGLIAPLVGLNAGTFASVAFGALVGVVAGLLLYLAMDFGGADAKLLAALGLSVGPGGMAAILVWTAIAGMLLSIIALVRRERDLAYVPAIAAGLAVHVAWPRALSAIVA